MLKHINQKYKVFITATLLLLFTNWLNAFNSVAFFELQNHLTDKKLYWLSQAISDSLIESISCPEDYLLRKNDLEDLYDQMGLEPNMILTHATLMKMSAINAIDYALIGSLNNEGNKLIIKAFLFNSSSTSSYPINVEGDLENIIALQAKLAKTIVSYINSQGMKAHLMNDLFNNISPYSFEMYFKALQEEQPEKKIKFLKQSLKENKSFPSAILLLGTTYYELGEYEKALDYYSSVPSSSSIYTKALFYKANILALQNELSDALITYIEGSKFYRSSPLFNNISTVLMKQGKYEHASWYLSQALNILPDDTELLYNKAILSILMKESVQAKKYLISFLNKNPQKFSAHFMLEQIAKNEQNEGAKRMCNELGNEFGHYFQAKQKFSEDFTSYLKLQFDFDEEMSFKFKSINNKQLEENKNAALAGYKNRIRENIQHKQYAKSLEDLTKAILIAPYDWELHYLRGKYYFSINDLTNAKRYLEFSLWCEENPETTQLLLEVQQAISEQSPKQ